MDQTSWAYCSRSEKNGKMILRGKNNIDIDREMILTKIHQDRLDGDLAENIKKRKMFIFVSKGCLKNMAA